MGRAIEQLAVERGHTIAHKIDIDNQADLETLDAGPIDVAIEFSEPQAAFNNIFYCLNSGIPILSGTTGWLDRLPEIEAKCAEVNGTFFYASNFSIGVNLFFKLNQKLAALMNKHESYAVDVEEIHHIHKKDAPSGTAITIAEGIIENLDRKDNWTLEKALDSSLKIKAKREDEVPGTHIVQYTSPVDQIEIKHTAFSRKGFVKGAVLVAEWLPKQKGVLKMQDFLEI